MTSVLAAEGGYQLFDLKGGEWAVLGFSGAAAVTSAHGTAHQVVHGTLQGVNEDLMAFAGYLDKAVEGLGDADDLSATALDQLAQIRYGSAGDEARVSAQEQYVPGDDA